MRLDLAIVHQQKEPMTMRGILMISPALVFGMGSSLAPMTVGGEYSLRVDAGEHDRLESPVTFTLPDPARVHWELSGPEGGTITVQADERGQGIFILDRLAAFQTVDYRLSPVQGSPKPNAVHLEENNGRLLITKDEGPVLNYQAEKGELPRDDLEPIYRRGGYIHPVVTPGGTVITDDYPANHKHHHGIWFPWTKTVFEGRYPDFWNMGQGTGTVEFAGLLGQWSGPVHAGFFSAHRFLDLTVKPPKIALKETWRVRVFAVGRGKNPFHLFELESVQKCATPHALVLPKYRYGGLGFRGHGDWDGVENCFYLTSNGESDRIKGHTTRARWCHVGGRTNGKLAGVGVLCHPGNFRFPQPMRIHPSEPFFNFAPSQAGDWEIKPGTEYVSRYRFVVSDGKPDRKLLDRLWNDFAFPPRVEIRPVGKE